MKTKRLKSSKFGKITEFSFQQFTIIENKTAIKNLDSSQLLHAGVAVNIASLKIVTLSVQLELIFKHIMGALK